MSRADTWMPLYIGDYLADTMHLTAEEHGAYLLLIMQYFRNGPLQADDGDLARMAKVDPEAWEASVGPRVRAFFKLRNGKLYHRRIDAERKRAENNAKKRAVSGQKGGLAKAAKHKQGQEVASNCHDPASDLLDFRHVPSPSPSPKESKKEERALLRNDVAATPPVGSARPDVRDEMWGEGRAILRRLTGQLHGQTGRQIGVFLKTANGDCAAVLDALRAADREGPHQPIPWIVAGIKRRVRPKSSVYEEMREDIGYSVLFPFPGQDGDEPDETWPAVEGHA